MPATVQDIESLLQASAATENFRAGVREVQQNGSPNIALQFNRSTPAIKALRAVTKLLEEEPGLAIDRVEINAQSGCSDFQGTLTVNGGERSYDFKWDCAWRAEQEDYRDHWGSPDQIRAAREFGYQCFERWQPGK